MLRGVGGNQGEMVDGRKLRGARLGMLLIGWLMLLFCIVAPGAALAAEPGYEFVREFGPDGTDTSQFVEAESVAVDLSQGTVYVLDTISNSVSKFDVDGNPVPFDGTSPDLSGNVLSGLGVECCRRQIAVDQLSHNFYVTAGNGTSIKAYQSNGEPALFTAGPGAGTNEIAGFQELVGVAVDSQGMIYASEAGGEQHGLQIYGPSGVLIKAQKLFAFMGNIAVDSNGIVYNASQSGPLERFVPQGYPVSAATTYVEEAQPVAEMRAWGVDVDRATNDVFASELEASPGKEPVLIFDESKALLGGFGEGHFEYPSGIAVVSNLERVFVSDWSSGVSRVKIFQRERCVCSPAIESSTAGDITSDSAQLRATINPNSSETTYWFEYGFDDCALNSCTKIPLVGEPVGSGHGPVEVVRTVAGLGSETTYHYRVVAKNAVGTTDGPDRTFTTRGSDLGFELSDSRVWEMVSPPNKHDALLTLPTSGIIQAAEDGNGLAYLSLGSIEPAPEGNRAIETSSVLARRDSGSWLSKDITPPHIRAAGVRDAEYKLMTSDLSDALLEARDDAPLSPLTTERTPYIRENTQPPIYTPLLTSADGHGDVPPGTEFDQPNLDVMGANRALTDVVLRSPAPLVPGAEEEALYVWNAGQIQPVSELPPGEGGVVAGSLGSGLGSVRDGISEDGSRIFWSPGQGYESTGISLPALYLRDTVAEKSVRLDVVQPGGSGAGEAHPAFQAASSDGTVVLFTDSQQLTVDASPEGRDLYRCEIPLGSSADGCATLTDISIPLPGLGESGQAKDQVLALSEDGKRAYFVAEGVLTSGANRRGDLAVSAKPNLYLWEQGEGTRFIATLSKDDAPDWGAEPTRELGYAGRSSTDASPSGRYLAFMSNRSLTGYENEGAEEAFRFDAVSGELICVSCNPTGASPDAELMPDRVAAAQKVDTQGLWADGRVAATLPEPRSEGFGDSLYRPRSVLDNGRVFFNAFDSLVSADSNDQWDVYEYEPAGLGSCSASSKGAGFSWSDQGCVGLLSSGTGEEESVFLDSSLSGDDVFFISTAALSALDEDTVYDVYDARVGGFLAGHPPAPACVGESCQPIGEGPGEPLRSASDFHGLGNIIARPRCAEFARRADRFRQRAEALARRAAHVSRTRDAIHIRREARHLSQKAQALGRKAKQCKRIIRRTSR